MQNEILSPERVRSLDESASSANEPKQIAVSFVTTVAWRTNPTFYETYSPIVLCNALSSSRRRRRRRSLARNSSYSLRHGTINHAWRGRECRKRRKKRGGGKRISKERKETTGDKFRAAFRRGARIPRVSLSFLSLVALPHREPKGTRTRRLGMVIESGLENRRVTHS